jgi:periplasmic protein TonB
MGLDEKAIEAVKKWKFEPARKDNKAVSVLVSVQVDFHLY